MFLIGKIHRTLTYLSFVGIRLKGEKMSNQPVFDNFGNQIGEFTPSGGDGGCGIFLLLLLLPLAIIGIILMFISNGEIRKWSTTKQIFAVLLFSELSIIGIWIISGGIHNPVENNATMKATLTINDTLDNVKILFVSYTSGADVTIGVYNGGPETVNLYYISGSLNGEVLAMCSPTVNGSQKIPWEGLVASENAVFSCNSRKLETPFDKIPWGIELGVYHYSLTSSLGHGWIKVQ